MVAVIMALQISNGDGVELLMVAQKRCPYARRILLTNGDQLSGVVQAVH